MRRRRFGLALAGATLAILAVGAVARAVTLELGNLVVSATADFQPRELPASGGAPASFGTVVRIKDRDGTQPPALETLALRFDKHGFVQAAGLPACPLAKIETATPAQARKACASSLVGTGVGRAEVTLPGASKPVLVSSPLSFFNTGVQGGNPTLVAHAYEHIPAAKALIVPITIEKVGGGRYGYEAKVQIPPIAEGHGSALLAKAEIDRTFKHGGREIGFANAYCSGGRLQVHGELIFDDGSFVQSVLTSPCHTHA